MFGQSAWGWADVAAGFLLQNAARATVLLTVSILLEMTLRRSSAARLHLLQVSFLMAVLVLPVLAGILPGVEIPLFRHAYTSALLPTASVPVGVSLLASVESISGHAPNAPIAAAEATSSGMFWIPFVWAAGVAISMTPILAGLAILGLRMRRARPLAELEWSCVLDEACQRMGITRKVRLFLGDRNEVPLTWGSVRPSILLPVTAPQWPEERRRAVIEHELAHVRRFDFAAHLGVLTTRALHWYNPLAWIAAASLRETSERACDDLVLNAGTRASEYAAHLVAVCRTLRPVSAPGPLGIAMARPARIERRVRTLLEPERDRRGVSRLMAAVIVVTVCLMGLLAATVNPTARAAEEGFSITVKALTDQLDPAVKKAWNDNGVASNEAILKKIQDVTAERLERRFASANLKGITIEKLGDGQVRVRGSRKADIDRVRSLVLRRGALGLHRTAIQEEELVVYRSLNVNADFKQRLMPLLEKISHTEGMFLVAPGHVDEARGVVEAINNTPNAIPPEDQLLFSLKPTHQSDAGLHCYRIYVVAKEPAISLGKSDLTAMGVPDDQRPNKGTVRMRLSPEQSERMFEVTKANLGRPLAIQLDGLVLSAPTVRSEIRDVLLITGDFTREEADDLAVTLSSGYMPAPLVEVNQAKAKAALDKPYYLVKPESGGGPFVVSVEQPKAVAALAKEKGSASAQALKPDESAIPAGHDITADIHAREQ